MQVTDGPPICWYPPAYPCIPVLSDLGLESRMTSKTMMTIPPKMKPMIIQSSPLKNSVIDVAAGDETGV
jgi:hypothetical protein